MRFNVEPAHIGLLLPNVGAGGEALTVTDIVDCPLVQPAADAVQEYVPEAAVVAPAILGFCAPDEKAFGPVHV